MSLTTKVLIALALGMGVGIALSIAQGPALAAIVPLIEPVGTLWINAIRMTVVPLVVGSIIVGVTSAPDARTIGRIGTRALLFFLVVLFAGGIFSAVLAPPLMGRIPLDPAAIEALRESGASATSAAAERVKQIPTFAQWLTDLVPVNPVKAAADGAMLPLIVFSLCFGLALTRLTGEARDLMVRFFRGIADAALTLVRWVLEAAPIGVFALAVPLAARLGLSAAGALVGYIAVTALLLTAFSLLVLYPLAIVGGRVAPGAFARAAFPAQAVAFSARSSLAALPALVEGGARLGFPPALGAFFLPLAVTTFRLGAVPAMIGGSLFLARLYGTTLSPAQVATLAVGSILLS
ncbi:MAG TPA: cation:dicarboxylase symporter family transporter, partial [Gemmatimonadaceae bacterium]|nr:cation:dicarboxylase symporter family transporter [Gemmatimonadaceae bacterium]